MARWASSSSTSSPAVQRTRVSAGRTTPPRMSLVNLATNQELKAQFNPQELQESLGAEYSKLKVPGYSHEVSQFSHTKNYSLKISLQWSVAADMGKADGFKIEDLKRARKFLMSACYPRRDANAIKRAGAPRILFTWPNLITITSVIVDVTFKHSLFNHNAEPVEMQTDLTLEEIRDTLILSDDIFENGKMNGG